MEMSIKFVDLQRQYFSIKNEIDNAIANVMSSGRYIGGNEVKKFETEFSSYIGNKYGYGVGSGSDALIIALQSLGIGQGDKVATVPFTFVSTVDAILHVGGIPVFVDVDPTTLTINVESLKQEISNGIKAIIPVHIYGCPANMPEIMEIARENDIFVVEDSAQAHGAAINGKKVGSFGDVSCFSFYPAKNLGAAGDGGFITTNLSEVADKIMLLREYGQREKYKHDLLGWNSRLDPIQAALLSVKLKKLDKWNLEREKIAKTYRVQLNNQKKIRFQEVPPNYRSVYHIFAIMVEDRKELQEYLKNKGIETGIHYPIPVNRQSYYSDFCKGNKNKFPVSELASKTELSLPMFPELQFEEIEKIVEEISKFYKGK